MRNLLILTMLTLTSFAYAEDTKHKFIFKDPQDGYFDLSDFIINKKGFVPVPVIITEPALGSFGFGFAPVFIQPNKPVEKDGKLYPVMPDITALFGAYTANGTWGAGGGHMGYIPSWGARYMVGGGYMDANMDYYFNTPSGKDIETEFNIKSVPVGLGLTKTLPDPRFSVGLSYMYMHNELAIKSDKSGAVIQEIEKKIEDVISGNISKFSLKLEFDTRDNIFTPNTGIMTYVKADWSDTVFGSDYDYGTFKGEIFYYLPLVKNVTNAFHFDIEQSVGDQPFYIMPYVNMRGVPTARYQGKSILMAELEERWDFHPRWSLIAFGGAGKAFDDYGDIGSVDTAWGAGAGWRYLIARKLKLRMGMDFAYGPEGFAWYIIFGSAWMRD